MKIRVFWDVTPCTLLNFYRRIKTLRPWRWRLKALPKRRHLSVYAASCHRILESSKLHSHVTEYLNLQNCTSYTFSKSFSVTRYSNCDGGRIPYPAESKDSVCRLSIQTGCRAHPTSYLVVPGLFPWGKAAGAWSWPFPFSAEFKNAWNYTSVSLCLYGGQRGNFTFIFPLPFLVP